MVKFILALLACLPLSQLSGCGAFPQDWRGTETVCSVHGKALKEGTVEVVHGNGTMLEPDDIREAGIKFPYARLWVYDEQPLGWPTRARVLYCPECRAERVVWLRSLHRDDLDAMSVREGRDDSR